HTAIVNNRDITGKPKPSPARDTISSIKLKTYKPNYIEYQSVNATGGLAVFSEMHYPKGWNAYIDGEKAPHFRADFVLRAMQIPAGTHKIEFKFEPEVVKTGGLISLLSSIG